MITKHFNSVTASHVDCRVDAVGSTSRPSMHSITLSSTCKWDWSMDSGIHISLLCMCLGGVVSVHSCCIDIS
ncbi:unnamed protein product, partial [Vitis vinifera]